MVSEVIEFNVDVVVYYEIVEKWGEGERIEFGKLI